MRTGLCTLRRCRAMLAGAAVAVAACAPAVIVPAPPPPPAVVVEVAVPADHTRDKHGALHRPGYKRPIGVCDACHGSDLRGAGKVRGCFACHGKEWD
ncbi:MAG TPA: hypothetical protein P5234_05890 [Thermoanaerobaculaceae bacterium]|nr:hypothetical protein [Thermoanaerobaculaceae bacterium]HRS15767.1 hypothetical protein [Thermoanaerobaculaceae bacterium]